MKSRQAAVNVLSTTVRMIVGSGLIGDCVLFASNLSGLRVAYPDLICMCRALVLVEECPEGECPTRAWIRSICWHSKFGAAFFLVCP